MNEIYIPINKLLVCSSGSIGVVNLPNYLTSLIDSKAFGSLKVVMTPSAEKFLPRLSIEAITGKKVEIDMFSVNEYIVPHIELARWADLVAVLPASANTLAKLAGGLADNLLNATVLASKCPVVIFPFVNSEMRTNPAVKKNIDSLISYGYHIVESQEAKAYEVADGCLSIQYGPPDIEEIKISLLSIYKQHVGV